MKHWTVLPLYIAVWVKQTNTMYEYLYILNDSVLVKCDNRESWLTLWRSFTLLCCDFAVHDNLVLCNLTNIATHELPDTCNIPHTHTHTCFFNWSIIWRYSRSGGSPKAKLLGTVVAVVFYRGNGLPVTKPTVSKCRRMNSVPVWVHAAMLLWCSGTL